MCKRNHGIWPPVGVRQMLGLVGVTILVATAGWAQTSANQSGQLFDANPQVGGSRYNAPVSRPLSPLVGGNAFATGNVSRGLSLRSSSPITAPTAFRGTLGSSTLSAFRRDSIGLDQVNGRYGGLAAQQYFDTSSTAPTASYLRGNYGGANAFGASVLGAGTSDRSSARVGAFDPFLPNGSTSARSGYSADAGSYGSVPLAMDNSQLSSSIFGVSRPGVPGPLSQGGNLSGTPQTTYLPDVEGVGAWPGAQQAGRLDMGGPMDLRLQPESGTWAETTMSPLDIYEQRSATDSMFNVDTTGGAFTPLQPGIASAAMPGRIGLPGEEPGTGIQDQDTLESMLGQDLFTDMRLALELSENPQADWLEGMVGGDGADEQEPGAIESMDRQTRTAEAAEEFLTSLLGSEIETFTTDGPAPVNEVMRRAESQMDSGRYYDAAQTYRQAQSLDPVNPLPVVGEAHALIAAGEYRTAAHTLTRGLQRYPELARFRINLSALLGGGEVVDIRRADLMRQLEGNEDPELRFVLGYIELHSGLTEFARENLERAAQESEFGTIIRRYPNLLRQAGILMPAATPESPPPSVPETEMPPDSAAEPAPETSGGEPQ